MSSDPNCVIDGERVLSETLVVGPDGGLQKVFVYVKDGLGGRRYATPTQPVVLDQRGWLTRSQLPKASAASIGSWTTGDGRESAVKQ